MDDQHPSQFKFTGGPAGTPIITGPYHDRASCASNQTVFTCSLHGDYAVDLSEVQFLRRVDAGMVPACPACASAAMASVVGEKLRAIDRVNDGRQLLGKEVK